MKILFEYFAGIELHALDLSLPHEHVVDKFFGGLISGVQFLPLIGLVVGHPILAKLKTKDNY